MAYAVPTSSDLKTRFPAFDSADDAVIDSALSEAALMVDDAWLSQEDFTLGRLLYAAHILTLDGHGTGAEAEAAKAGAMGFQTMKSGALTLTRFQSEGGSGGAGGTLSQTQYGRRFVELQRRNVGGPMVVF